LSEKKALDCYEVGYGKPPKNTQFQKGVSGNPRGRPKKARDFDTELLRESNSFMTITENGKRKRISKHEVAIKQLMKQAMTGSPQAQRIYFPLRQQALEKIALMAGSQPGDLGEYNANDLTDDQLAWLIRNDLEKAKVESERKTESNKE
jgi:hypothetical protein